MKKINNYCVVLLASIGAFAYPMEQNTPVVYLGANDMPIVYNPKIYVPRDAEGKPLGGRSSYHEIQAEVVKQQDTAHAASNNLLMAASFKALEQHEKKAKL